MILHRLADGIKNQDWFVVVIEIFIVVIGIYIGLQVDDWNKARKDRSEEVRIVRQLTIEVEAAIEVKERVFLDAQENEAFLIAAIEVIQGDRAGDVLTPVQCEAVWRSHILIPEFSGLLTYQELSLSGKLGLLSNLDLRSALIAYQYQAEADSQLRNFIRSDVANVVDTYGDILPRKWLPESQNWQVDCQLSAIRQNQTFINKLQSNLGRTRGMTFRMEKEITMLRDILEIIEGDEK